MRKTPFDFAKLSEIDKKKESHFDHITTILEENNLVRKQIAEGPGSLLKAISDSLYFTGHYQTEIQQFCIKYLKYLIANNKLPPRLSMFKGNSTLWKDFTAHPHLPGFEKIILELISLLFKVKVILYHVSDDSYLHATMVNHKFDKNVELIRTHGNHFDSVRSKKFMAAAGVCQNIVLNMLDQALAGKSSGSSSSFRDMNGDNYINIEYDSWLQQKEELAKEGLKINRGRHKKSLSDNFNVNFDSMEEQQLKFYNMFMSSNPPDEFIKLLAKDRKETEDNLGLLQSELRYSEEPWFETPGTDLAIKNYPVSSSNLSSRVSSVQDLHMMEKEQQHQQPQPKQKQSPNKIFFDDSVSPMEYQQMEGKQSSGTPPKDDVNVTSSPVFFVHSPPPGLTPTRYPQKTYSNENLVYTLHTPEKVKASSQVFDYASDMAMNSVYHMMTTPPPHNQFHHPAQNGGFMRKAQTPNPKNLMLATGYGDEFKVASEPNLDQGQDPHKLQFSAEKRKPIILDEGKSRHTGRLKFFDENKNYGFIIMDEDGSDIFVHYDDLQKAGVNKDFLKSARMGQVIKMAFNCMKYIGKYDKSRKATDIQLLS